MSTPDRRAARWLQLLGELLRQPLVDLPRDLIADELIATFDAHAVSWNHCTEAGQSFIRAWPEGDLPADRLEALRPCLGWQPLQRWYTVTQTTTPHSLGRVPCSIADARSVAAWRDLSRPLAVEQQIGIPLQVRGREQSVLVAARPGRDFTDADLDLARLVQPVLAGLERQATELARWKTRADPARTPMAAAEDARLSGRELVVLSLLAEGLTAATIGRRLGIATRTVHKHLEHIYTKLSANNRITALVRAQQLGLVPLAERPGSADCLWHGSLLYFCALPGDSSVVHR
jgi:DNA-binding CsgD family transcriptional regulator